jgi:hypothetical protein
VRRPVQRRDRRAQRRRQRRRLAPAEGAAKGEVVDAVRDVEPGQVDGRARRVRRDVQLREDD